MTDDDFIARLAAEGAPIAAIARATQRPSDEIRLILLEAKGAGAEFRMPAHEWPPRGARSPTVAPFRMARLYELAGDLQRAFGLTQSEARLLAVLFLRDGVPNESLYSAIAEEDSDPDIVRKQIGRLRQKLAPLGIEIETMVGHGFRLKQVHRRAIRGRLASVDRAA